MTVLIETPHDTHDDAVHPIQGRCRVRQDRP